MLSCNVVLQQLYYFLRLCIEISGDLIFVFAISMVNEAVAYKCISYCLINRPFSPVFFHANETMIPNRDWRRDHNEFVT